MATVDSLEKEHTLILYREKVMTYEEQVKWAIEHYRIVRTPDDKKVVQRTVLEGWDMVSDKAKKAAIGLLLEAKE